LLTLYLGGCSWQSDNAEHFIGPMLFRYSAPPIGKAYVGQVIRFGISAEAGINWGLSIGLLDRVAVTPLVSTPGKTVQAQSIPQWVMPLGHSRTPEAGRWNFCLVYCRVERKAGIFFISRTIHGAEMVVGGEANAFSIGIVSRTLFTPPDDAIAKLHYERARPLESQAMVWFDIPERGDLPSGLLKEITYDNAH
jgi:hypothetical protein